MIDSHRDFWTKLQSTQLDEFDLEGELRVPFDPKINTLYLDCDGVMADFDALALSVLGMEPRLFEDTFGSDVFWDKIGSYPNFYAKLPLKHDAMELYDAVKHLHPPILTGSPNSLGDSAVVDKYRWVADTFGVFQRAIVCQSKHKSRYCIPGDVIVDDWPKHRLVWEAKGGTWVHHNNASETVRELKALGVI